MSDLTGGRLGPFEIKELLGVGGFATVYRAHDPRLRSDVAIKLLAENHALNPKTRERFLSEAHALRRVQSSAVVSIFDIQQTSDGQPYLVLEFADRGTLADRRQSFVAQGHSLTAADVGFVVDALADALDAIHVENLVHRDVTPANLLLRSSSRHAVRPGVSLVQPNESLLLSDMGLVKDLDDSRALTIGGGTAGFWAPEQRQPLGLVDARSDIWAATAVVLWLITGSPPFETTGWRKQVLDAGYDRKFLAELERGVHEDTDQRPATAGEWQRSLRNALDLGDSKHRVPDSTASPVPSSNAHRRRNRFLQGAAAAVVAIVLVLIAGLMLARGGDLNPDAVRLPGGDVTVTSTLSEAEITIVGPEAFEVGETVTYRATAVGATELIWIDPLGDSWRADVLDVTANSPGRGSVTAIASAADDQELRAVLQFEVRTADS